MKNVNGKKIYRLNENQFKHFIKKMLNEEINSDSWMKTRAGADGKVFENIDSIQDPTRDEMLSVLANEMGGLEGMDSFSAEEAMYWYAYNHHGGQNSNLYSVLSTSEYKPSRLYNNIEDSGDEMSLAMYNTLVSNFGGEEIDMQGDNYDDEDYNSELNENIEMEKTKDGYIVLSKRLKNGDLFKRKYMDYTEKEARAKFKKEFDKEEETDKKINETVERFKNIINYGK